MATRRSRADFRAGSILAGGLVECVVFKNCSLSNLDVVAKTKAQLCTLRTGSPSRLNISQPISYHTVSSSSPTMKLTPLESDLLSRGSRLPT